MIKNFCHAIASVLALANGSVHSVARPDIAEPFRPTITHKDGRLAFEAVTASVTATSVGVDRPVEWEVVAGDVVDDRLGLDLDEFDPAEVRGVEDPPTQLEEPAVLHPRSIANT